MQNVTSDCPEFGTRSLFFGRFLRRIVPKTLNWDNVTWFGSMLLDLGQRYVTTSQINFSWDNVTLVWDNVILVWENAT